jgi:hypothetical protein
MALTQISTAGVKDDAVTSGKIPANAVGSSELADNAVDNAAVASNAAIAGTKVNPEFGGQDITSTGDSDIYLQLEKTGTRTWKAKYETNSTIAGNGPTLKITTNKDVGGAGEPGLGLYIDEDMHLHLWDDSQTLPTTMPHTNVRPTFSVYGDVLIGDIIAIADNPMTYFMRVETGLDRTKTTNLFSAKNGASDTDGGPTITMSPDETGSVDSGYISLTAYSQGTGSAANAIRFQNRTSANTVTDRAIINKDGNFGVGKTTGLSARITASHSSGTIGYFESTQGSTNVDNIIANSTQTNSSANLKLQINGGTTANSIIRCNGNNDTVILNGASPAEKARFLAGGGLTFNGDTAAANALDDYEEGTWTPVWTPSSGSFTSLSYNVQLGKYVKVGNLVTVWMHTTITSVNTSGASGSLRLTGLPYTTGSGTVGDGGSFNVNYYSGMNNMGDRILSGYTAYNNSFIVITKVGGAGASGVPPTDLGNGHCYGCAVYNIG